MARRCSGGADEDSGRYGDRRARAPARFTALMKWDVVFTDSVSLLCEASAFYGSFLELRRKHAGQEAEEADDAKSWHR